MATPTQQNQAPQQIQKKSLFLNKPIEYANYKQGGKVDEESNLLPTSKAADFGPGHFDVDDNETIDMSVMKVDTWKPARLHSYEIMGLADSQLNCKIRPCGFRKSGKMRKIKKNCLIAKMKTNCRLRGTNPKLAVCITMYNEDEQELKNTLSGLLHNYNEMRIDPDLQFKKQDFIVFLICDGYDRIPESFRKYATEKQFFDESIIEKGGYMVRDRSGKLKMKDIADVMDDNVTKVPLNFIHMFMVQSWDFGLQEDILKGRRINFVFAIKHRNDGKINSHKWFFQGLCKYMKPELCLMLDIGTRPDKHAVFKLYKYMTKHKMCGGCCGEIEVDFSNDRDISSAYFVKAAQFFEYKMGHSPDKACESFFGFNSVLPGAYSLFRWQAISGEPLDQFFKSVTREDLPSCAEANEFLAEDRVMCLQIYIKKNSKYHLAYIPDAKAFTDAPDSLAVLIKQRRRWMNGAMFGTVKVISNFVHMVSCHRTKHSWYRQCMIVLFLIYYTTTFLFQFFTVGSMYASITLFLKQSFGKLLETGGYSQTFVLFVDSFFDYFYIAMIMLALITSLTTTVDKGISYFVFLMCMFGLLLIFTMVGIIAHLIDTGFWAQVYKYDDSTWPYWKPVGDEHHLSLLVVAGTVMCTVFLMPMILRPFDFLSNVRNYIMGLISYLFMMPTFINIMQIYAMCNLHDISWGNRPTTQGMEAVTHNAVAQELLKQDYQLFRAHFLFFWLISNAVFGGLTVFLNTGSNVQYLNRDITFLDGFALFVASLVFFKFIFSLIYIMKWNFRQWTDPYYRKSKVDVADNFKAMRKRPDFAYSSDEDDDIDNQLYSVKDNGSILIRNNEGDILDVQQNNPEIDDSDNDDMEFDDDNDEDIGDLYEQQQLERSYRSMSKYRNIYPNKPSGSGSGYAKGFQNKANHSQRIQPDAKNQLLEQHQRHLDTSPLVTDNDDTGKMVIESAISFDHDNPYVNRAGGNKTNSFVLPKFGRQTGELIKQLNLNNLEGEPRTSSLKVALLNKNDQQNISSSLRKNSNDKSRLDQSSSIRKAVRFQDPNKEVQSLSRHQSQNEQIVEQHEEEDPYSSQSKIIDDQNVDYKDDSQAQKSSINFGFDNYN